MQWKYGSVLFFLLHNLVQVPNTDSQYVWTSQKNLIGLECGPEPTDITRHTEQQ
jgi:hypothetical protein